jgi:hypothetical protein
MIRRITSIAGYVGLPVLACLLCAMSPELSIPSVRASSLPRVTLNAESISPRPIEQRTGETVTRDYAQAWQDLADALDSNRSDLLQDYFTGEARDRLTQRISDQKKTGLRTRYQDHGHQVKAVFYSPDGGEMQLVDQAQIDTQVFDGATPIYTAHSTYTYLVLMTPGADRWYVRSLESFPEGASGPATHARGTSAKSPDR